MSPMNTEYTAIIKQDDDWWVGWIEEVPGVNCQESSREQLLDSLRVTLQEAPVLKNPLLYEAKSIASAFERTWL